MTLRDDLVKRLRDCAVEYGVDGIACGYGNPFNPDGPEAADRIEAQEAEIARLREALRLSLDGNTWAAVHLAEQGTRSVAVDVALETAHAALQEDKP